MGHEPFLALGQKLVLRTEAGRTARKLAFGTGELGGERRGSVVATLSGALTPGFRRSELYRFEGRPFAKGVICHPTAD